ncbi:hypothetical protein CN97_00790 [Haematobacter massiliensis]|uniref:Anti-CBASS protein Acb1-like N-terminal domain-containing protein n=1 Tax=Haematobacter massiliensis TaxID=195105 RepID=A0A086Y0E7_9RHOB|nr:anti-CBASS Acb1 family protein [Haematobacter massiliensis]KFI27747.1 hypothetical protein CN97_00790 [Haematobacter massiliensis]OWJ82720.1 DUF1073 domain-containing protein [Haematobacter massiliensis]
MSIMQRIVANSVGRLAALFPMLAQGTKHNFYADFGYPETLTFAHYHTIYSRNGIARAGVAKTVSRVWQSNPFLLEAQPEDSHEETAIEEQIRRHFDAIRAWQMMAEVERRALVGGFAGLILRIADGRSFDQPVQRVGSIESLVEVIPAWSGQLTVAAWNEDPMSPDYGKPLSYQFNESAISNNAKPRSVTIHPDRIIVWSDDATMFCDSMLQAGYNDLLTLEKVSGAGGEGFWKNAKNAPIITIEPEADLRSIATGLGVNGPEEVADKLNDVVEDFNRGFDSTFVVKGMSVDTLPVTLPDPGPFYNVALQSFAASINIPLKILVGNQTGERASTEDSAEWDETCMSRRANVTVPNIMAIVRRLVQFGALPERDWFVDWTPLTESSPSEKLENATKMAAINSQAYAAGELVFEVDEIRAAAGYEALAAPIETETDEEADAASGLQDEEVE